MEAPVKKFCKKVIEEVESGRVKGKAELEILKLSVAKSIHAAAGTAIIREMPSNPDILSNAKNPSRKLLEMLSIKPLRTLSGVAPVAIMTRPDRCPHGTCIYCPGGPGSPFGNVPQSYTGHEPATMRGISNNYDPYAQTISRIEQYYATAHNPEKIELIIMGGTFPATPRQYQEEFIEGAFRAANDFPEKFFEHGMSMPHKFYARAERGSKEPHPAPQTPHGNLEREQARNEEARIRIVTMCIETKPDWCKEPHINEMLHLGATRVELGAQSLYDEVLAFTHRGHTLDDTIEATRLLKDSGLKVTYHMMPGQPMSSHSKDIEMFREAFGNDDFRPDGLKIYPCMVMPGTALAKIYEQGKFSPLSTAEAAEIIAEAKRFFPEWTRVHRVQRDIPVKLALGGIDKNNLRQLVEQKCEEKGARCRCIRCRESGINTGKGASIDYSNISLVEREYTASKGKEVFISFEDMTNDLLLGFCRLRMPHAPFRKEFTGSTSCIRELHVFGAQLGLGEKKDTSQQHRGFGHRLLSRAEEIAKERFGADKMLVTSGVGAREYYRRKHAYSREGAYMAKEL
ncbi:MAG: tRNA uridine(34) 5-carboxymethylaminomethyl modification radical SAM/GNAT enzyme Elp3 [Candidatus Diapherotrites archaeon]|uniref:tRNA carboxymethyluridine synthase n=1 Tax=Candidatus Iainarchaeum sp. TaxID=3101447 RepID=A0A8T3YNA5_9ARCH|nr:tRNA uridine(34) 5-carboxymethylaminomethyl modification radical SAM/GNAT enzyme Elp3 [Candidatus Diapherotrites archaeon]